MNTNMSSANNGIIALSCGDFTNDNRIAELIGHPAGYVSGINVNPALQLLLASKNDAQRAEFETATGWSWQDACEASIATETATLLASKNADEIAAFEAETGWSWSDAVDESILAEIESRLQTSAVTSKDHSDESDADKFERETGWTIGDAVDMAAELRREDRIFGHRVH